MVTCIHISMPFSLKQFVKVLVSLTLAVSTVPLSLHLVSHLIHHISCCWLHVTVLTRESARGGKGECAVCASPLLWHGSLAWTTFCGLNQAGETGWTKQRYVRCTSTSSSRGVFVFFFLFFLFFFFYKQKINNCWSWNRLNYQSEIIRVHSI